MRFNEALVAYIDVTQYHVISRAIT
jgi:hypothetical protein